MENPILPQLLGGVASQGKEYFNLRAVAELALDVEPTTMALDDMFDDGEAKPCTT